jgi:5-methylcytosine-specific restriction endonuclease McrA
MKQFLSSFPPPQSQMSISKQKPRTKPVKAPKSPKPAKPYKKKKIPAALREAVWIKTMGKVFQGKCPIPWCYNTITVFDFQAGHNIPESKGGETKLPNLIAICSRCNTSMGNTYTIDEWSAMHAIEEKQIDAPPRKARPWWKKLLCCFS